MAISPATSTLSRFPAAAADFVRDLYLEHLEEASFLYDQRNYLLEHIEAEARDIAWNEERCDRHLDVLVTGDDLTLAMCQEKAASGDGGGLYAAMRVFCKANRPDLVKAVLDELNADDDTLMAAARDGLKHELPQSWSAQVSQWLQEADEPRAAILAVASAYREVNVGPAIVLSASEPLINAVPFLQALGPLREPTAATLWQKHLRDADDEAKQAAAIVALRCGDEQMPRLLRRAVARGEAWAAIPLSLVGKLSDLAALQQLASACGARTDVALALGLLGNLAAMEILLEWLETDGVAESAAVAAHLLSGLYPLEQAPVNETPATERIDERYEGENEYRPVEVMDRPVLSRSRPIWELCLKELPLNHNEVTKMRFGDAESAASTLGGAVSPRLPLRVRNLLIDSLAIRQRAHVCACDAWHLARQPQALAKESEGISRRGSG